MPEGGGCGDDFTPPGRIRDARGVGRDRGEGRPLEAPANQGDSWLRATEVEALKQRAREGPKRPH